MAFGRPTIRAPSARPGCRRVPSVPLWSGRHSLPFSASTKSAIPQPLRWATFTKKLPNHDRQPDSALFNHLLPRAHRRLFPSCLLSSLPTQSTSESSISPRQAPPCFRFSVDTFFQLRSCVFDLFISRASSGQVDTPRFSSTPAGRRHPLPTKNEANNHFPKIRIASQPRSSSSSSSASSHFPSFSTGSPPSFLH